VIIDKIDGLATLLTGQIEGLDRRLTGKIEGLDQRLTGQMSDMDQRLTGEIGKLTGRLDGFEGQMSDMDRRLNGQIEELTTEVRGLNEREDLLFQKVVEIDDKLGDLAANARVDGLEDRMMIEFDKQTSVLNRLDEERLSSLVRMDRIEGRLNSTRIA